MISYLNMIDSMGYIHVVVPDIVYVNNLSFRYNLFA